VASELIIETANCFEPSAATSLDTDGTFHDGISGVVVAHLAAAGQRNPHVQDGLIKPRHKTESDTTPDHRPIKPQTPDRTELAYDDPQTKLRGAPVLMLLSRH
jgi:hypothetical protein